MKTTLLALLVIVLVLVVAAVKVNRVFGQVIVKEPTTAPSASDQKSPLDFKVKDIDGNDYDLSQLKGKVVMFVNVASKCGFTPQYDALEKTYEKYKEQGLVIVGFPANNFKSQEPGTNAEIKQFCTSKYNVTFPMMSKISVKGEDIHPLYKYLTQDTDQFKGDITWNFNKFLVDRNGQVFARFGSKIKPDDPQVTAAIEKALAAK